MELSPEQQLGGALVEQAIELGFACAGIASVEPSAYPDELDEWLKNDMHGSMAWMEHYTDLRKEPIRLIDNARSILMVGDLYASRDQPPDLPTPIGEGKIARYARGKDYHKQMKKRLLKLAMSLREQYPDVDFKVFVDTAPVLERELAQRAGIGWSGKHTLLIHPKLGSYMFIGGIVTSLDAHPPVDQQQITDHCGSCTKCIDTCPTGAITDHQVDARRCISYLTIEHREPIDEQLQSMMGDWIYGCDVCQEVCPHNSYKPSSVLTIESNPVYHSSRSTFDLLEVINWTENDRREAFVGSAMKRAKLGMMKRNAKIVQLNQRDRDK